MKAFILDAFECVTADPTYVVADADRAPAVDGLTDPHLSAFVEDEEVRSGLVRRGLGVDDALYDDGLFASIVTVMQRTGAAERDDAENQRNPADMKPRLAEPDTTSEGEDKRADEGEDEQTHGESEPGRLGQQVAERFGPLGEEELVVVFDVVDNLGLREGEVVLAVGEVGLQTERALVGEDGAGYLALLEVGVAEVVIDLRLGIK